jgi:hypothetical protein
MSSRKEEQIYRDGEWYTLSPLAGYRDLYNVYSEDDVLVMSGVSRREIMANLGPSAAGSTMTIGIFLIIAIIIGAIVFG